ncbi:5'-nucleotidase C-terminal domain-containing protein [Carnobacterium sp. TMP28]|uniref:5'-nucleotidase C-terminal domain-containing protein n=1 Tax=Carnobacterium sp. TMP28 TaxID=3397060 RepID=UPI0039E165C2
MKNWRQFIQSLVVLGYISTTLVSPVVTVLAVGDNEVDPSPQVEKLDATIDSEKTIDSALTQDEPVVTEEDKSASDTVTSEKDVEIKPIEPTEPTEVLKEDSEEIKTEPKIEEETTEPKTNEEKVEATAPTAKMAIEPLAADKNIALQIMGINDFHGALNTTGTYYSSDGTRLRNLGTAPLLATYMNEAEQAFTTAATKDGLEANSIRVDSGDRVGASPAVSGLLQDEPTIRAYKAMGFDIGTLGNHEFDEGLAEYYRITKGIAPEPGKFKDYVMDYSKTNDGDNMEIVIANVVDKGTTNIPYGWEAYTVKEVNGVKVGFIGIVTTDIPNLVLKQHYVGYDFLDEAETIEKYSKELKAKGVEAIVVLAHVSALSTFNKDNPEAGNVGGDVATILGTLDKSYPEHSVDAVFSGHNHQAVDGVFNGTNSDTLVVQSSSSGKGFVNLIGELNPTTKDFAETPSADVIFVEPGKTPEPNVDKLVKDTEKIVDVITQEKIGTASGDISREVNEYKESALGNFITDGQLKAARDWGYKADFAMTNNGGIRDNLKVKEDGKTISWGAAQATQPFGNLLQIVEMKGSDVLQVLNEQYDGGQKYFLQLSGLTYRFTETAVEGQEYGVLDVTLPDGSSLDLDKTYTVVINDFILGGGDGFAGFTKATKLGEIDPDTDIFISYIKDLESKGVIIDTKVEGRKQYISIESVIKDATTLPELTEKTKELVGVTVPKATVEMALRKTVISTVADDKGNFTLDLSSLNLKVDDVWKLTVINPDGFAIELDVPVVAAKETPVDGDKKPVDGDKKPVDSDKTPVDSDKTPVDSDKTPVDSDKTPVDSDKTPVDGDKKPVKGDKNDSSVSKEEQGKLPQTGSQNLGLFSLIGIAFAGSGAVILFKQKKLANKK